MSIVAMSRVVLLLLLLLSVVCSHGATGATENDVDPAKLTDTHKQQHQQQMTIDKLLSKLSSLGVCQNILIQQNIGGSNFFNRTWSDYKAGFGSTCGNYWLGNEQLHRLTKDGKYKLRFELQSKAGGQWNWAEYDTFTVGNESTQYRLTVGGFSGNIGCIDAVNYHNGMKFSTKDRDNDLDSGSCAQRHGGGFWHRDCAYWHVNAAGDQFKWWYTPEAEMKLQTSRMWLVCR